MRVEFFQLNPERYVRKLYRISLDCSSIGLFSFILSMNVRLVSFSSRKLRVTLHLKRSDSLFIIFSERENFWCISDNWPYLCLFGASLSIRRRGCFSWAPYDAKECPFLLQLPLSCPHRAEVLPNQCAKLQNLLICSIGSLLTCSFT